MMHSVPKVSRDKFNKQTLDCSSFGGGGGGGGWWEGGEEVEIKHRKMFLTNFTE